MPIPDNKRLYMTEKPLYGKKTVAIAARPKHQLVFKLSNLEIRPSRHSILRQVHLGGRGNHSFRRSEDRMIAVSW